jgi:indole-3-glycerol phosphate synthase
MPTILDKIVAVKVKEIANAKANIPLSVLKEKIKSTPDPIDFRNALLSNPFSIIAEIKKSSPSKGLLAPNFDPVEQGLIYANHGASAISILTDTHFDGTMGHLIDVKRATVKKNIPILRKDFLIDPYQIYESKIIQADAVLLIVAILGALRLEEMLLIAKSLNLQCLVEVHSQSELDIALNTEADIIGINNRNLHTFEINLDVTEKLAPMVGLQRIIVSESGIKSRADILRLQKAGAKAALIGETLMTANNPKSTIAELLGYQE